MTSSTDMHTTRITPRQTVGPLLVGRSAGARLLEEILRAAETALVVVDFEGVEAVSPSFADELFGKPPPDLARRRCVRFAGASDEVRALARGVRGLRAELTVT